MESKIKGVEAKINDLKIDLKVDLTNFLQEILTNGERAVKETHDVNERNVIMIS